MMKKVTQKKEKQEDTIHKRKETQYTNEQDDTVLK